MQASTLQLTYALHHEFEQLEERAWLCAVFGVGVVLFTVYRWNGSLAARIALELAEPAQGSGEAGNA